MPKILLHGLLHGKAVQVNKQNLTAPRVDNFVCDAGKTQSFLWDTDTAGLGVRATVNGAKSYIFQSVCGGKTIRMTIGSPDVWTIPNAREEARRLQRLLDQGEDPRERKAEQNAKDKAAREARQAQREAELIEAARNALRVADAWQAYIDYQREYMRLDHIERGKKWGERHLADHIDAAQPGGQPKKRGKGLTVQGVLYPVLQMRLADVNAAALTKWQRKEAAARANKARQGFSMFRAFWRWCACHNDYRAIIDPQAVEAQAVRSEVPSRKSKKFDVLERGQLQAWFAAVRGLSNPVAAAYLQTLLLTGARREELAGLCWSDVDFKWKVMWLDDKVEADGRKVPLTPYVAQLLASLPRRNEWVFSSTTAKSGRIQEPVVPHNRALDVAGLPHVTIHGLRRTFKSISEWVEMPVGVVAQIMGHKPSATAEKHYTNRPLDLLAIWHGKYEAWILEQAGIEFSTSEQSTSGKVVALRKIA